jgi:hypothetical protein
LKNNNMKNKPMIMTAFVALALAAGAQILVMNNVAAAPSKIVEGTTPCCEYSSTLTCPDGTPAPTQVDPTISFNGAKINNGASHFQGWSLTIATTFNQLSAGGNTVQISPNNFQFKGAMGGEGICNSKTPSNVELSGSCGFGVTVKFAAANGMRGTFNGINVACHG